MGSIPDDFVLDVHDLAAIILDAHASTEPLFPTAQLQEINRGSTPPTTIPAHILPPAWHAAPAAGQSRVAYLLKTSPSPTAARTTLDTFANPKGVYTPTGLIPPPALPPRTIEDAFWRCKTFNAGYLLAHVAQRVLSSLPSSTTLRALTSTHHALSCRPRDVAVAEIELVPREAGLIVEYKEREDLGPERVDMVQHLSGFVDPDARTGKGKGPIPWVFLLLGEPVSEDMEADPRVVLDLVTSQLGGRGGGGEVFSLERAFDYHAKVLPKVAEEREKYVLSGKIVLDDEGLRARADALVEMVMERVRRIASGQDNFCRYCGKDGVEKRCSKCKKAYFCPPQCQTLGWKYHKLWCS